ncbi:hypothetical protein J4G48_0038370 [Bradyrhizobium barranii subsp. apii]|uniref:TetR/AcrR family transcriptional regulator n=1 Tax=Bradyrhizobium barranii TaxID=2992140 RepID=UPI001AA166D5|nr:hypothetical protein [Bradyrhizobium barranii]UPT95049.1 hypothetical protein J4G48_0038370 [Bradyrhizobium barranii subsp. apii]
MIKRKAKATLAPTGKDGTGRRPGRPQAAEAGDIGRAVILRAALRMTKTVPLQDLSIVSVARTMKVTPALIHYYIGGRDSLTSGTMNLFYEELIRKWPQETDTWQAGLLAAAKAMYDHFLLYSGVAAYCASNGQFRVFQLLKEGEHDYGVEMLERFIGRVKVAGLSGERTGIYAHLFGDFIINTAYGGSLNMFPSSHRKFIQGKQKSLDPREFPNIAYVRSSPVQIDAATAFEETCHLFLLSISAELSGQKPKFMLPQCLFQNMLSRMNRL